MSTIDALQSDLSAVTPLPTGGSLALVPVAPGQASGMLPAAPAAAASGTNVTAVLKALRRHWLLACCLGVLCSATLAGVTWTVMPASKYTVASLLKVSATNPSVVFQNAEGMIDFQTFKTTQQALVKSRLVLTTALRDPKVARLVSDKRPTPVEWLEQEIKTDFTLAPEIMRVSMKGDHPEEMTVLVNSIVKAYLDEIVNNDYRRRRANLTKVQKVAQEYKDTLEEKRKDLGKLMNDVGATAESAIAVRQKFALEQLHVAQMELVRITSELRKAEIQLKSFQAQQLKTGTLAVTEAAVEEALRSHPELKDLQSRRHKAEEDLKVMLRESSWGPGAPAVRNKRAELKDAVDALEAKAKELRPQLREDLRRRMKLDVNAKSEQLVEKITQLKEEEAQLKAQVEEQSKNTKTITTGSQEIINTQKQIEQTERVSETVSRQAEALNVELRAPERVTVFEEASARQSDDFKKRMVATGGAGLGGLALVLFGIAWREVRFRRVNSVDEVINDLGLSVMGTLPALPKRLTNSAGSADLAADPTWQCQLTESVDSARTLLMHAARKDQLKVVMIASAVGGEGKTSLATQLAVSLARTGRRTLLIDCDLRNPAAHRVFDLPRGPGMCELLRGEVTIAEALRPTPAGGLKMICAGRSDPTALQALAQNGFEPILERLKSQFDFIVVDSCPVLPVADALLVGQHVDGVIFSILQEVSRTPMVAAAYQRLQLLGIRMLGAVVLGTQEDTYGQVYRYLEPEAD